ncbi:MAG: glutathione peroxidase [Eubacterium sp.]
MNIYDFKVKKMDEGTMNLNDYKGNVLLIVNTASKCGFTPQFDGLEALYQKYKDKGFVILGFPCTQFKNQDPGSDQEIESFCRLTYGVSFPMLSKIEVNGENAEPLFNYLKKEQGFKGFDLNDAKGKAFDERLSKEDPEYAKKDSIKWNFTKFLVDRDGCVVQRYEPMIDPSSLQDDIEKIL